MFAHLCLPKTRLGYLIFAASLLACGSEKQFHHESEEKIIGGNTSQQAYTFMASLQLHGFHYCGATLISRRTLLTAAHCSVITPTNIRLGSVDKESGGYELSARDIGAIIVHPDYKTNPIENDIALIRLNVDVPERYKPIDLASIDSDELADPDYRQETGLIAAGWGLTQTFSTEPGDLKSPRFLQEAPFTLLTRTECQERWGWVAPSIVCTHQPDWTNTCRGDSGGPLFRKEGNRFVQIGITSFGYRGCHSGIAGFADVHALRPWIEKHFPARNYLSAPIFTGQVECKDGRRSAVSTVALAIQSINGDSVQANASWRNQNVALAGSLSNDNLMLWSEDEDLFIYGRFPLEKDKINGMLRDRNFCRLFSTMSLSAK